MRKSTQSRLKKREGKNGTLLAADGFGHVAVPLLPLRTSSPVCPKCVFVNRAPRENLARPRLEELFKRATLCQDGEYANHRA